MDMDRPGEIFQIRQCRREGCEFRFPTAQDDLLGNRCPACGALTRIVRVDYPDSISSPVGYHPQGPVLEVLLDNIRSTFNVGGMFRTADGAGVRRLHLSGITPTPENPKVSKTALGAETSISWTYHRNGLHAAKALKEAGMSLWALEAGPSSISIYSLSGEENKNPVGLIVGNEVSGVDPDILALCDRHLSIPMLGIKRSLNVAIAFGIAVYHLRFALSRCENEYD